MTKPAAFFLISKVTSEIISFRHSYYKFAEPLFTTVRDRAEFKQFQMNQPVIVETPDESFPARILSISLLHIQAMSLEFMKRDGQHPGYIVNSPADFIGLLNSLRAPSQPKITIDSELTVLTIMKHWESFEGHADVSSTIDNAGRISEKAAYDLNFRLN